MAVDKKLITFHLTVEQADALEQIASELGMNKSEVIRRGLALMAVHADQQWIDNMPVHGSWLAKGGGYTRDSKVNK